MKLHFPWDGIEKLLTEVITAKTARTLYGEVTGPGLWLAGDDGVYLLANTTDGEVNATRKPGEKAFVVHAEECDPTRMPFEAWWANKQVTFGGDDGVEFFSLANIVKFRRLNPTHLAVEFRSTRMVLEAVQRKGPR